jgi:hypothetical protein
MSDKADKAAVKSMSEAMQKNMSIPESPPLSATEILKIVDEMNASDADAGTKAKDFGERYPRFLEQCPVLFRKACGPGLDMNMIRFMVQASSEEGDAGGNMVGERLAKKFVYPKMKS